MAEFPEFPWSIDEIIDRMGDQFSSFFDNLSTEGEQTGFSNLLSPVAPYNSSAALTPLVTVAGVISLLLLSGVALGAFATLLTTLLAVYFLLTEVFGYDVQLAQPYTAA